MDKKAAEARIQMLQEHHDKYMELLKKAEQAVVEYRRRADTIFGQIEERKIDLTLPPTRPRIPVFKSKQELEEHLAKRGKGPQGETKQEGIEKRKGVHKTVAKDFIEGLANCDGEVAGSN